MSGLEDEFVLNCIHGAKHFWERLMWPADIAAMTARHPEISWERAASCRRLHLHAWASP